MASPRLSAVKQMPPRRRGRGGGRGRARDHEPTPPESEEELEEEDDGVHPAHQHACRCLPHQQSQAPFISLGLVPNAHRIPLGTLCASQ